MQFLKYRFDRISIDQNAEEMTMDDDAKYRDFEEALRTKLAETEYSLKRVTPLAKARPAVDRTDLRYFEAVERAFARMS
jgi:hypothetical protein